MTPPKTLLITGASGFLGKYLLENITYNSIGVYNQNPIENGIQCDLSDKNQVKELFNIDKKITTIVHCAGDPSPKHPKDHEQFIKSHILSTSNLLEYCDKKTVFIYISSVLVFGDHYPEINPTNLYGSCKLSCEYIVNCYSKLKKLTKNIIRPCSIVGPGLTHGLIYDINKKLDSDSRYLELFGNEPGTCKPYVHIDEVTRHVYNCARNNFDNSINCFPGDSLTVKQVAELVMRYKEKRKPIKWLGEKTIWPGDNRKIDTSKQMYLSVNENSIQAIQRYLQDIIPNDK